jgi:hypothetical protein
MSIKGKSSCLYNLDKTVLQQVTENPYLGILLSEDLGWSKHIAKTASKASSTLGFVRRNLIHILALIRRVQSMLSYGKL